MSTKQNPFFEKVKAGLEEALKHARGEIELRTTVVETPDPPPQIDRPAGPLSNREPDAAATINPGSPPRRASRGE